MMSIDEAVEFFFWLYKNHPWLCDVGLDEEKYIRSWNNMDVDYRKLSDEDFKKKIRENIKDYPLFKDELTVEEL